MQVMKFAILAVFLLLGACQKETGPDDPDPIPRDTTSPPVVWVDTISAEIVQDTGLCWLATEYCYYAKSDTFELRFGSPTKLEDLTLEAGASVRPDWFGVHYRSLDSETSEMHSKVYFLDSTNNRENELEYSISMESQGKVTFTVQFLVKAAFNMKQPYSCMVGHMTQTCHKSYYWGRKYRYHIIFNR